jgi:ATP phosphoribosyltransferase
LVEVEAIADISARLVVNQSSYKRKRAQLQPFFEQLK